MAAPCIVIAAASPDWFRAMLPPATFELLDITFVDPKTEQSITAIVGAVEAARREPSVVVAHSANGLVAFEHAATHPAGVLGVVAIGTPPAMPMDGGARRDYWDAHASPERRARFAELEAAGDRAGIDALFRWYDLDFDPAPTDALSPIDVEWAVRVLVEDAATRDWDDVRARVTAPVLLGLGACDYVAPPTLWDGVATPPATTTVVFERSGHQPFFDEPDAFVAALADWLRSIDRPY